jgi:hypothetical protein
VRDSSEESERRDASLRSAASRLRVRDAPRNAPRYATGHATWNATARDATRDAPASRYVHASWGPTDGVSPAGLSDVWYASRYASTDGNASSAADGIRDAAANASERDGSGSPTGVCTHTANASLCRETRH